MATTNDIKNGSVLNLDGQLWSVIEFQHVKPGKGGAFVRTKIRNVRSGKVVDKTFNAGTKVDFATVDRRDYSYLYQDGQNYVFMDQTDYDQVTVPSAVVGDAANFMLEGQEVQIAMHEGEALQVEMPASVVLEVTYTEPGLQGDRSSAGTKPATLETGYEIQVPLFLESNTKVKVDTRTGEYLGRVTSERQTQGAQASARRALCRGHAAALCLRGAAGRGLAGGTRTGAGGVVGFCPRDPRRRHHSCHRNRRDDRINVQLADGANAVY